MANRPKVDRPTYIMVSKRLIVTWLVVNLVQFAGILASFQYANYVDRKSNHAWCEQLSLFNQAYAENPPPSDLGRKIAAGMLRLTSEFCN